MAVTSRLIGKARRITVIVRMRMRIRVRIRRKGRIWRMRRISRINYCRIASIGIVRWDICTVG
jgi:hypothetical protein